MTAKRARAFLARRPAKILQDVDRDIAGAVVAELHTLPTLEEASRRAPISDVPGGYRSVTLPSGYMAVYRRLTPVEIRQVTGDYMNEDAYLVADLVRLVPAFDGS